MTQARQKILHNIRQSLGRNELDANTENNLKARLAAHTVHEQPALETDLINLFIKNLKKVDATLELIPNAKEIPFAVLAFLQKHNLAQKMVLDAHLKKLPWPNKWHLAYRAAQPEDALSVTRAYAGLAETGSLVLLSSAASPTTLNFLPENHLIVLHRENLVPHIEAVWTRLRIQAMPRSVNIITGPSRTADIEQTIQLGAHGPRRLHVILVN